MIQQISNMKFIKFLLFIRRISITLLSVHNGNKKIIENIYTNLSVEKAYRYSDTKFTSKKQTLILYKHKLISSEKQ
jgi:hypothetical protein